MADENQTTMRQAAAATSVEETGPPPWPIGLGGLPVLPFSLREWLEAAKELGDDPTDDELRAVTQDVNAKAYDEEKLKHVEADNSFATSSSSYTWSIRLMASAPKREKKDSSAADKPTKKQVTTLRNVYETLANKFQDEPQVFAALTGLESPTRSATQIPDAVSKAQLDQGWVVRDVKTTDTEITVRFQKLSQGSSSSRSKSGSRKEEARSRSRSRSRAVEQEMKEESRSGSRSRSRSRAEIKADRRSRAERSLVDLTGEDEDENEEKPPKSRSVIDLSNEDEEEEEPKSSSDISLAAKRILVNFHTVLKPATLAHAKDLARKPSELVDLLRDKGLAGGAVVFSPREAMEVGLQYVESKYQKRLGVLAKEIDDEDDLFEPSVKNEKAAEFLKRLSGFPLRKDTAEAAVVSLCGMLAARGYSLYSRQAMLSQHPEWLDSSKIVKACSGHWEEDVQNRIHPDMAIKLASTETMPAEPTGAVYDEYARFYGLGCVFVVKDKEICGISLAKRFGATNWANQLFTEDLQSFPCLFPMSTYLKEANGQEVFDAQELDQALYLETCVVRKDLQATAALALLSMILWGSSRVSCIAAIPPDIPFVTMGTQWAPDWAAWNTRAMQTGGRNPMSYGPRVIPDLDTSFSFHEVLGMQRCFDITMNKARDAEKVAEGTDNPSSKARGVAMEFYNTIADLYGYEVLSTKTNSLQELLPIFSISAPPPFVYTMRHTRKYDTVMLADSVSKYDKRAAALFTMLTESQRWWDQDFVLHNVGYDRYKGFDAQQGIDARGAKLVGFFGPAGLVNREYDYMVKLEECSAGGSCDLSLTVTNEMKVIRTEGRQQLKQYDAFRTADLQRDPYQTAANITYEQAIAKPTYKTDSVRNYSFSPRLLQYFMIRAIPATVEELRGLLWLVKHARQTGYFEAPKRLVRSLQGGAGFEETATLIGGAAPSVAPSEVSRFTELLQLASKSYEPSRDLWTMDVPRLRTLVGGQAPAIQTEHSTFVPIAEAAESKSSGSDVEIELM